MLVGSPESGIGIKTQQPITFTRARGLPLRHTPLEDAVDEHHLAVGSVVPSTGDSDVRFECALVLPPMDEAFDIEVTVD